MLCGLVKRTFVLAGVLFATGAAAQQRCEQGIIRLPSIDTPGRITLCHAVEQESPAVAAQLVTILESLKAQQADVKRLARNINSVGDRLETPRQAELVQSLLLKLLQAQTDHAETVRRMDALNEQFDDLKEKLLQARSTPMGTEETQKALSGRLGDAIAKLDLTRAESMLESIDSQLKTMDKKLDTINENTHETNSLLRKEQLAPAKIQAALAASDMATLAMVREAGVSPTVIAEALRQPAEGKQESVAFRFFETSAHSQAALDWLDWALKAGLDPEVAVPNDYYEKRSLLIEAMRAGNAQAMEFLLQNGASPHPYEDLLLTAYPRTRFLLPLSSIADDARYSTAEKQQLVESFRKAGVAIPELGPARSPGDRDETYQFRQMQVKLAQQGLSASSTPSLCQQSANPICKQATKKTGTDWCGIIQRMPKRLAWNLQGGTPLVADVTLLYLLRIDGDTAFFLGKESAYEDFVLVETAKDGSMWNILRFMDAQFGMGLCKRDGNSPQLDRCWRSIPLHRKVNSNEMEGNYPGPSWKLQQDSCTR